MNKMINHLEYLREDESLLVMTRDNCLRLINLKNEKIPNIYSRGRFMNENVKFTLSPDKQIILSGGENGIPLLWDFYSTNPLLLPLSYKINGKLLCVDWNNKYNMIALAGFGSNYPVTLYYFSRESINNN